MFQKYGAFWFRVITVFSYLVIVESYLFRSQHSWHTYFPAKSLAITATIAATIVSVTIIALGFRRTITDGHDRVTIVVIAIVVAVFLVTACSDCTPSASNDFPTTHLDATIDEFRRQDKLAG